MVQLIESLTLKGTINQSKKGKGVIMKMWEMKVRSNKTHQLVDHDYFTNLAIALAFAKHYKGYMNCRISLKYATVHA